MWEVKRGTAEWSHPEGLGAEELASGFRLCPFFEGLGGQGRSHGLWTEHHLLGSKTLAPATSVHSHLAIGRPFHLLPGLCSPCDLSSSTGYSAAGRGRAWDSFSSQQQVLAGPGWWQ